MKVGVILAVWDMFWAYALLILFGDPAWRPFGWSPFRCEGIGLTQGQCHGR